MQWWVVECKREPGLITDAVLEQVLAGLKQNVPAEADDQLVQVIGKWAHDDLSANDLRPDSLGQNIEGTPDRVTVLIDHGDHPFLR
ncbi:hypothetical protein B4Q13_20600 [Lacticaseibacillus rhamnosus]